MAVFYMLKSCWRYADGCRGMFAMRIVLLLFVNSLSLASPVIFAKIINLFQSQASDLSARVTSLILLWAGVCILRNIGYRVIGNMTAKLVCKIRQSFAVENYAKVSSLPLAWHTENHSGDTINRINTASETLESFIWTSAGFTEVVVRYVGSAVALAFFDLRIAVIAFAIAAVLMKVMSIFDKWMTPYYDRVYKLFHKINATMFDFIGNIRTIIILRLTDKTRADLNEKVGQIYKPYVHVVGVLGESKWLIFDFISMLLTVGMLAYYLFLQINGGEVILYGSMVAVFAYLEHINGSLFDFAQSYHSIVENSVAMKQMDMIDKAAPADGVDARMPKDWKKIDISHLSFAYKNTARSALSKFGLVIRRGKKIAIVGESGAGKSTLMSLLRGLYPADANVVIDGKASRYGLAPLHKITTLMPQDPEVFENTIEYNITMGLRYPKAEIAGAIKLARFDKVLKKLPLGLKTDIREKGVNLSGGERQRLALARNILVAADSDIILMDEPTSSVDMENESAIYDGIFKKFKNKTIISSVHKKYLLDKFDEIVDIKK